MSQDPSGIRPNYKFVAMKDEDEEQRGDRGEEVSFLTDDGEHFVPSLIGTPRDDFHDPSGIRHQYEHKKEDGGEQDGGGRFLEPTLIRLPPAEDHGRGNTTVSDAGDNNKKPAATAELSRVSDRDVSPGTVGRTLSEPDNRIQFPLADSSTCEHLSTYKMEMKASSTAPPSVLETASLGDPWPSSGITTLPGAQWVSPQSARIKNDTIDQAAAGNKPMLRPHFVSSQATEPPLTGSAQPKSPPVWSPSTNVAAAAAAAPPPNNNNENLMHVKASIRGRDKLNVTMKSVPTDNRAPFGPDFKDQAREINPIEEKRIATDNRAPFGPDFKDQAREINPIEEKRIATDNRVPFGPEFKDQARDFKPTEEGKTEDVDLHERSAEGPTFRHQTREEDTEEEIDTEAGDATSADRGHGYISNGTTRLVQAELVIPTEAEVIEEKPQRKALFVVLALLLTGAIAGAVVGSSDRKSVTQPGPTDCDQAIELELGNFAKFNPADASTNTWVSCNISDPFTALAAEVGWYQVIGNGTRYTVTTCGLEDSLSDSSVLSYSGIQIINVYSGMKCQNLTCRSRIGSQSNQKFACNDGVSWLAESGVQYWIQVLVSEPGNSFPVTVFPTPPNQDCEAAIMLEAGQATVNGTTLGALAGPKDSFCDKTADDIESPEAGPAVWYSVTGTDKNLTAFACPAFDSEIFVYNGTCGNLACIDGNGDYGSSTICSSEYKFAAVSWFAEAEMVYHIKVTSVKGMTYTTSGRFELGIQIGEKENLFPPDATPPPDPPRENDNCEGAKWVSQEPTGSTLDATPSGFLSDELIVCNGESFPSYHLSPDVWYQFNGTGEWHTATTCTGTKSLDMFDSNLVIYSGTCSNLTCVTSSGNSFDSKCSKNSAIVSWLTEKGETYLIRVAGKHDDSPGDFGIRIYDGEIAPPEPVNNHCETATLLKLDQVVNGTTLAATLSGVLPICNQATDPPETSAGPDVWYHILGTGDVLTVTTCTNSSLDTKIDTALAVYTGNCTSEMTCIAENDDDDRDSCSGVSLLSGVSWHSELNEEYHVRVYSYDVNGEFGSVTFGIKVYSGTPDGKPPPDDSAIFDSTIPPD